MVNKPFEGNKALAVYRIQTSYQQNPCQCDMAKCKGFDYANSNPLANEMRFMKQDIGQIACDCHSRLFASIRYECA